jgi:hypothetical protein
MLQTNTFDRKQMRMNLTQRVTDFIKVGGNFNFSRGSTSHQAQGHYLEQHSVLQGLLVWLLSLHRTFLLIYLMVVTTLWGWIMLPSVIHSIRLVVNRNLFNSGFVNPAMVRDLNKITSQSDQILADVSADIKILRGLTFRTQYGINWQSSEDKLSYNPLHGDGIQYISYY